MTSTTRRSGALARKLSNMEHHVSHKQCRDCEAVKPCSAFPRNANNKDGLYTYCRDCTSARNKQKYVANLQHNLKRSREYKATYPEAVVRWNAARKSKPITDRQRQQARDRLRAWKKANRGAVNADKMRRIASQRNATPAWADRGAIRKIYEQSAGLRLLGFDVEVDHLVPLNSPLVCGLHVEANLRIVPTKVNQQKGNKTWPDHP